MVEKKTKKPRTKYGLVGMVRTPDFGSMTVSVDHGPPTEKRTAAFNAVGHALVMATSLRSGDALAELTSCIMGLWEKHSPPKPENAGQGEGGYD